MMRNPELAIALRLRYSSETLFFGGPMATRLPSGVSGSEVKRRVQALGLTVKEFAERLGLHETTAYLAIRMADAPLPIVRHLEDLELLHKIGALLEKK